MFAARAGAAARLGKLDAKLNEDEDAFSDEGDEDYDGNSSDEEEYQVVHHHRKSMKLYIKELKEGMKTCFPLSTCLKRREDEKPESFYRSAEVFHKFAFHILY
jgi:hypothetical protein